MKILLVTGGGSIGALSRYALSLWAATFFGTRFPWGTLTVNLSGCFLIGLAFAWAEQGLGIMNPSILLFFMTGFLGALTTFSTFSPETVNSLREGTHLVTVANFLSNNYWCSPDVLRIAGGPSTVRRGQLCNSTR
jgi:CrcB protein